MTDGRETIDAHDDESDADAPLMVIAIQARGEFGFVIAVKAFDEGPRRRRRLEAADDGDVDATDAD